MAKSYHYQEKKIVEVKHGDWFRAIGQGKNFAPVFVVVEIQGEYLIGESPVNEMFGYEFHESQIELLQKFD